jgi:hypothetical protein
MGVHPTYLIQRAVGERLGITSGAASYGKSAAAEMGIYICWRYEAYDIVLTSQVFWSPLQVFRTRHAA